MAWKRDRQINFRVELNTYARFRAGGDREMLGTTDFTRRLALWALEKYDEVKSLYLLEHSKVEFPRTVFNHKKKEED